MGNLALLIISPETMQSMSVCYPQERKPDGDDSHISIIPCYSQHTTSSQGVDSLLLPLDRTHKSQTDKDISPERPHIVELRTTATSTASAVEKLNTAGQSEIAEEELNTSVLRDSISSVQFEESEMVATATELGKPKAKKV